MEQRSEDWFAERLGKITGTRAVDLMGTPKAQEKLMATLIKEIATAQNKEISPTKAMKNGIITEPKAIAYYELINNVKIEEVGLLYHPDNMYCACSPDGLIEKDGGIEVKCPEDETHVVLVMNEKVDPKYVWQMNWCMYVSGRKYWDYFNYSENLPEPIKTFTKRFERDESIMSQFDEKLDVFIPKLEMYLEKFELMIN